MTLVACDLREASTVLAHREESMRATCQLHRVAVTVGLAVVVSTGLAVFASTACAFTFNLTDARDWARAHYNDRLYLSDYQNGICTGLVSCTYRFGASVPRGHVGYNDTAAWWSDPDDWGSDVGPTWWSDTWFAAQNFRNHFNSYEPSGTTWTRKTRHRCSAAPDSDDRWSGGHVVFYHHTDANLDIVVDYFHSAVIYGRNVNSAFSEGNGTCKVERTGPGESPPYRNCNFINLKREGAAYRQLYFVQVNTLVNN